MTIAILDAERFRRQLAGLEDDRPQGERTRERLKELAAQLCFLLARYYNRDELDPLKLWERIGSAIATACEQVDDGDLDRYVSIALEHVRASHSRVAADEEWNYLLAEICEQPESDRLALVNYLHHHSYAVLIHGRRYWEQYKDGKENRDDA
jgi:hypothetical protein